MICGVVLTSISGFGVCTVCRVVCDKTRHAVHTSKLKYLLPQRRISYNDVFLLINSTMV